MAALSGTALALLILVAVVASAGYVQTRKANALANQALGEETRQRQKAEAVSQLSIDALDEVFERFAPARGLPSAGVGLVDAGGSVIEVGVQPVLSKEAAALLEHMVTFYDRLADQAGDSAELRPRVADANRRVGAIHQRLGHIDQAEIAYGRALAAYQRLRDESGDATAYAYEIARIFNEQGRLARALDDKSRERGDYLKALATLREVPEPSADVRYELARTHYFLGTIEWHRPGLPPPPPRRAGPPPPRDPRPTFDPRAASDEVKASIALLTDLGNDYPRRPEFRHLLARAYRDLAALVEPLDPQAGVTSDDRACAILESLVDDYPAVPEYRYDLAEAYANIAEHRTPTRLDDRAFNEPRLLAALEIAARLVAEHPNVPEYALSQVHILHKLSHLSQRDRRPEEAEQRLRDALDLQAQLALRFPEALPYRIWLALLQQSLAAILEERGEPREARALLEAALEELEQVHQVQPDHPHLRAMIVDTSLQYADLLVRMEDRESSAPEIAP